MASDDLIQMTGVVEEVLPGMKFKVKLPKGQIIWAYVSGKLVKEKRRIIVGDRVEVQISPYDLTKGRIVHRYIEPKNN